MTYVKLFQSILQSTIWQEESHVRLVWITILAMSDLHGNVSASVPGIAHTARVTLDQAKDALEKLMSPDPYSRTPDYEGRRLEAIDGGWHILNYLKYKHIISAENQREANRIRQERHRSKAKSDGYNNASSRSVTENNLIDIDIEKKKKDMSPPGTEISPENGIWVERIKKIWPKKQYDGSSAPHWASTPVAKKFNAILKSKEANGEELAMCAWLYISDLATRKVYFCSLETFLGPKRIWFDYLTEARNRISAQEAS